MKLIREWELVMGLEDGFWVLGFGFGGSWSRGLRWDGRSMGCKGE